MSFQGFTPEQGVVNELLELTGQVGFTRYLFLSYLETYAESTRFVSLLELCNVVAKIKHRYIHRPYTYFIHYFRNKTTNMACLLAALTHPGGSCLKNKLYVIWINYSVSEKRRISYSCNWTEKGREAISYNSICYIYSNYVDRKIEKRLPGFYNFYNLPKI